MRYQYNHSYLLNVQFEDLDAAGVVHHPNYLKYYERARGAALLECGYPLKRCMDESFSFAVAEVSLKYWKPLTLDLSVCIVSRCVAVKKSSLKVIQCIYPAGTDLKQLEQRSSCLQEGVLAAAQLRLVCIDLQTLKSMPIPTNLREQMNIPTMAASDVFVTHDFAL